MLTIEPTQGRRTPRRARVAGLLDTYLGLVVYRSEEHTSELQSLMRNSYAVFCLKKKTDNIIQQSISSTVHLYKITTANYVTIRLRQTNRHTDTIELTTK